MKILFVLILTGLILSSCAKKSSSEEGEWRYLYDMGLSSFYAKNYSEAIAHLYRATKVAPEEPKVWNALGITYMEVEEYKKAEEAFRMALVANPEFSEAKMNLGILFFKTKDYKGAIKNLEEAIADETFDKKHMAFYHLAKVYKELGDREKYLEYLRKATAYNPMFIDAQLELGSAYMDLKKYDEAEELFKSLISNNFTMPNVYLSLAKVYYETGRLEKAKEAIRMVLENKQANNLQKAQAYELLSKVLVEEQKRAVVRMMEIQKESKPKKVKRAGRFGIQIAAFSTRKRAQKLAQKLNNRGLNDINIIESAGIYKVIYGNFETRKEARKELERLKRMEIYGFIVEVD
jgi:tetratricopeptide (TPR) repeat protein